MPSPDPATSETLADDLLDGAEAISEFTGWPVRRVFYLLEKRLLPARKVGNRWISLKSRIRRHVEDIEEESNAVADRLDPVNAANKLNRKTQNR